MALPCLLQPKAPLHSHGHKYLGVFRKEQTMKTVTRILSAGLQGLLALGAMTDLDEVHAQGVYRSVGPDGKVTFSDRAPAAQPAPALQDRSTTFSSREAGSGIANLPSALRQANARFPVTIYSSSDCAPCASARNLLKARGVPFSERTVQSNDDIDALKRLSGNTNLPFATIGKQQLSGFSDTEWTQYLDAAGYPKQSQLPPAYQHSAAIPLVAVQRAEANRNVPETDVPGTAAERRRTEPTPAGGASSNPAGIRF